MNRLVICDTGVLSRYMLETPMFLKIIEQRIGIESVRITPIIRIELMIWLSNFPLFTKPERARALRFIKSQSVVHLSHEISELAIELSNKHINSKPGDTLIAATALYHDLPVYTLNKKDFSPLGVTRYE